MISDATGGRWTARPIRAAAIRSLVFLIPIAGSMVFVRVASEVIAVPTGSFLLFISWWILMSAGATVVLVAIERAARRLLPLVALYKLSLVFPDAAPSRFRSAMRSNTTETLAQRVERARSLDDRSTPVEEAERLLALVADLNTHDRLTRGHSERVRAYAQLIGKELHLSDLDLDLLNWAALLHDVGKLNVPTEILTKPGRLTDGEWSVLRRHPEFGTELTVSLRGWLGQWYDAVGQHHEHWDGKGYPLGLAGEEIGLAARIVAVADVFDVITSARSYKSASPSTAARDEIARCAGSHFDPQVVRAFLNISLGRLRLVMGPLSWLTHAPILARLPLTPAIGTVTASLATVAAVVTTGLVATPPSTGQASTLVPRDGPAGSIESTTREDESVVIGLENERSGATLASVRIVEQPAVGRARATAGHRILYVPPPDFSGTVSVQYRACWVGRGCRRGVIRVTVLPVNDEPTARDDRATTRRGAPVAIDAVANDSDPEGDPLGVLSVSDVAVGEARIVKNTIRWSPPTRYVGSTTFGYTATDGNGGRARARVTVRVTRVASAPATETSTPPSTAPAPPGQAPPADPAAASPANTRPEARVDRFSVPEGGTVLVDVLANDSDPDGEPLSIVSVGSPSRGTVRKVGDRLQFNAPSDYVGQITFPYTITDPGGARDSSSVSVTVLLVNAPPSFSAGPDQVSLEDAGPRTVSGWASSIGPGATSEADQVVSFLTSNDNNGLFAAQPEIAPDGTLRYETAENANGSAIVTVRARDDGGTANGGVDVSLPQTFAITVLSVNDAPSFGAGPDETVSEGPASHVIPGWARGIRAGPTNEAGQTVGFVVSNDNPALFTGAGQPDVAADGSLTYTLVVGVNGSATVTVRARDDGGTGGGGADTSAPQTFTISVLAVNDPPSFTSGPDQSVPEDAGAQSVGSWATTISPGPPDESGQIVAFVVTNDTNTLFSVQPALAPDGTLTFTPAANANGSATVTVRAADDGGTAGGGVDTSAPQTFTITIAPANDPPVANPDSATVDEDDPAGVTFNVLTNDTDVDVGDALTVSAFDDSTILNGTLTDNGGGSFTYTPDADYDGSDTFSYTAGDGNGGTSSAVVTLTVTAQPDAPNAATDAYSTQWDTQLVVAAPGVLDNDSDEDGDALTVQTAPIIPPTNGVLVLSADGSFTYAPSSGFSGTDSFTYRVDDGTGRTDDAVVTITVSSSITLSSLYFSDTGPLSTIWGMTASPPGPATPVPDYDDDGEVGLTVKESNGDESNGNPKKLRAWAYTTSAPLVLNGPVTLRLWSTIANFGINNEGHPYVYLYDCAAGGIVCTRIAENDVHIDNWNGSVSDWMYRTITVGSVDRTIAAGRALKVVLLFEHEDLWLAMTAAYPSGLTLTVG